jgi:hypothetical protein
MFTYFFIPRDPKLESFKSSKNFFKQKKEKIYYIKPSIDVC